MSFQAPWWLLGLLAVVALVVLYVVLQLRRKAYAARFTNVALLGTLVPKRPGWRRHLAFGLVALGLAALIVSLAVPSTEVRVPRERATVVMAVDVSLSMQATDIEPSRF
jgi:Ca-activated chloride channel homolog